MNETPSLLPGHSSLYTHCSLPVTITFLSCLSAHLSVLQRPNVIPSCAPTLKMMQFQHTGPNLHSAATSRTNTWAQLCLQTDHQPPVYPKSWFREKRETKTKLKPNRHSNSYSHEHAMQVRWKAASENNSSPPLMFGMTANNKNWAGSRNTLWANKTYDCLFIYYSWIDPRV